MIDKSIIDTQLKFFKSGRAGCLFAAHAANDPMKYEWRLSVSDIDTNSIGEIIHSAIKDVDVSTQSIIFPTVVDVDTLQALLVTLNDVSLITLEQEKEYCGCICLGYRIHVGKSKSWVTGFGSFDFLPKTRQAVFTDITFRSKPRPNYEKVMKDSPLNTLHLADMNMQGMREYKFKSLWYGSLDNTEEILGHKPDLRSAAKTTFAIPLELWDYQKRL